MAIQTLHDSGSTYAIPAKYDGGCYQVGAFDCVCGGVGDNFQMTYSTSSLNISFASGSEAIIGGAFFKIKSTEAVTLTANSTIYLCANIDLTAPNGSTGSFKQRTSSNMQFDNLNGSGSSRDLLLYVITTSATGVTDVQDKRFIVSGSQFVKESDFDESQLTNDNIIRYVIED